MKRVLRLGCLIVTLALGAMAQDQQQIGPPREAGAAGQQPGERRGRGPGMEGRGTFGVITEIKGDTITLQGREGRTETVKVTAATRYQREGQDAKLSDFKIGDRVAVIGERSGEAWTAQAILSRRPGGQGMFNPEDMGKRFIAGEVTKIEDTKLTIHRVDGQDQVIEVDETTSFRNRQRESITLTDIKVGDKVAGRGEVKNGTFVPAVLNVGEVPMGGRRGPGGPPPQSPNTQENQLQAPVK